MLRRLIFSLFFLQTLFSSLLAQRGTFIPSERFSSMFINDLCQDQYGYMWIATDYGLNRFDGYHFKSYFHRSGDSTTLGSNIVTRLYQDSQGRFWVGTRLGLYRYDHASDRFVSYLTGANDATRITSLLERKNGEMLVGTSGHGLWTVSGDSLRRIPGGYTTSNWFFNQMMEDSHGRFWKCGYGDELTMMDDKTVHQFFTDQGVICRIIENSDEMVIICQHGICSYRDGQVTHADIDLSALDNTEVDFCSALKDHEGNIYIGTMGDGLFRLPVGSRRLERVECTLLGMDLNTAKILSICEDRYGNIWLGCQSKGLVILPSQQPQFAAWSFSAQRYFISSTITSLCEGDDGLTWCSVPGSGVYAFDAAGRIVSHPAAPAATECIFHDRRGRYWLATSDALYTYDPAIGRYQRHISLVSERVNAIIDDEEDNLYISTYARGFCIYNPTTGTVRHFNGNDTSSPKGRLSNNWIQAMLRDSHGLVWLATALGVSCYNPATGSFRDQGFDCLMDSMICFSLCETSKGDILIGSDQGLYRYKPGTTDATPFPGAEVLADKSVAYIAEAEDGGLWCATSMGIWQYDAKSHKFIGHVNGNGLHAKEYITSVGMQTSDDVYFAYNDGLIVFRPTEVTGSHKQLPDVKLTACAVAGNAVCPLSDSLTVSFLDNAITLEFSLLDFNNPRNIIYEYRIEADPWIKQPEGDNTITLSHLSSGNYDIEVRAKSGNAYSPVKRLHLRVTPPWYRSTWAYLVYALLLLGVIVMLAVSWRNRAHFRLAQEKLRFMLEANHSLRTTGRPRILIVENDVEMANHIISELNSKYKFDYVSNGKEALKMLLTNTYSLVVSAVMMPEMDGITLLKRIKGNLAISEIPVIVLSAKAEVEHKLLGLKAGADAYIPKPFDIEELHVRIDNLIENVRRLRGKFSGNLEQKERVEQVQVKGNDEALMERIMKSINAHLSEPKYNVDEMAADVGISRAQLHRKMKEITGTSTGKFLRNIRMEQAARMLVEGKINISQIANRVGYTDNAHFSVAFKNHFGLLPSEYVEKHKY